MDYRAVTALMFRLASVWILVTAANSLPTHLMGLVQPDPLQADLVFWSVVMSVLIPVLLGTLLIYFPGTLVRAITTPTQPDSPVIVPQDLQAVALSTLGVYWLLTSLAEGFYHYGRLQVYYRYVAVNMSQGYAPPVAPHDFGAMVYSGFIGLVGLGLILGARGLARLLARLRG